MERKNKKNITDVVVKSNALIDGTIKSTNRLTATEQKILMAVIKQIDAKNDIVFRKYRIWIKSFMDDIGTTSKNEYKRIVDVARKLRAKEIHIPLPDGRVATTGWITDVIHDPGKTCGYFDVILSENLEPYLLQQKKKFTQWYWEHAMRIKSGFSIRMYEILKSVYEKNKKEVWVEIIQIEEIRNKLGIQDVLKQYVEFKRKVLDQAKKDFEKFTDLTLEYTPIKNG